MWLSNEKIFELTEKYGTPLYVYDEKTLRSSCKDMLGLLPGMNFEASYSAKANTNIELLKIIRDEGLSADAMSAGEIYMLEKAGFTSDSIFFIPNNVSEEEMRYAIERDILISADSLSQLEMYGRINEGGKVAVRFNPGHGFGHHDKVVTAGKHTKFGVDACRTEEVAELIKKYKLKLAGINQHLGSLILEKENYLSGARALLSIAGRFDDLEFIDFGGGFGVTYKDGGASLDLPGLAFGLKEALTEFLEGYGNKDVLFRAEPGRYIVAECGILLGRVNATKRSNGTEYIGTDLGFNVLARPVMYDSYHEVKIAKKNPASNVRKLQTVVGNICESGDILAKDRELPGADTGDIAAVLTAGAYGFVMASNYNCRLRPAEVLIGAGGTDRLIRRRETFEDLHMTQFWLND